jgi:hypothetical protein
MSLKMKRILFSPYILAPVADTHVDQPADKPGHQRGSSGPEFMCKNIFMPYELSFGYFPAFIFRCLVFQGLWIKFGFLGVF